jgi:hypothetical protein
VTQGAIPLALGLYVDGINSAGPVTSGTPGAAGAVGDNAIRDIVLGSAGASSSDNRFAELPRTTIWGVVFADHDRDRQLTAADRERLRNVTIELRQGGTGCNDATLLGSTVTAADGSWVFPGGTVSAGQVLPGQTYRVCERQPADYLDGPTLPGVNGTSPTPNQIVVTNLPLAGSGNNWFAEWTRQTDTPSSISGTVFIDRDRDGLFTTADPGRIDSVVLRLVAGSSCSGTEIGRTSTDTMGRYRFPGGTVGAGQVTAGGTYSVCEEQPTAYGDGPTRPGTAGTRPADNHILIASLPASGSSGNDFGELGARIAGRVYLDLNHNGRIDSGEAGIGNVNITVVGAQGQRNLLTDADGRFAFDDLPAGTWNLVEQDEQPRVPVTGGTVPTIDGLTTPGSGGGTATAPGAQPSRISGITLPAGGQAIDNLFGERLPVTPPGPGSQPSLVVTKGALHALHGRPDGPLPHHGAQCRQRTDGGGLHGQRPPARRPDAGRHTVWHRLGVQRCRGRQPLQLQQQRLDRRQQRASSRDRARGAGGRRRSRCFAGGATPCWSTAAASRPATHPPPTNGIASTTAPTACRRARRRPRTTPAAARPR